MEQWLLEMKKVSRGNVEPEAQGFWVDACRGPGRGPWLKVPSFVSHTCFFTKCTVYSALEEKLWGCMVLVTLVFCKVLGSFSHVPERGQVDSSFNFQLP